MKARLLYFFSIMSECRNKKKNLLGDWTCNNLSDENPQGTPGPVTGPQG